MGRRIPRIWVGYKLPLDKGKEIYLVVVFGWDCDMHFLFYPHANHMGSKEEGQNSQMYQLLWEGI